MKRNIIFFVWLVLTFSISGCHDEEKEGECAKKLQQEEFLHHQGNIKKTPAKNWSFENTPPSKGVK